jgi:hypothetical protein
MPRLALHLAVPSALCALLLGSGCDGPMNAGGGGGGGMFPDAMVPADARTSPPDGVGGGSGFVSNTPGATVVDIGQPATPNAVLISSNLLQSPSGSQVFQEWLGEFKNTGSTLLCQVQLQVTLQDASGATLATFSPFAYGAPYMAGGLTVSIPCVEPGQIASFYDNGFVPSAVDLPRVSRITVDFSSTGGSGVIPAPHAPQLGSHVDMSLGEYDVAGSMTGVGGPVYAISLTAFPRTPSGLAIAYLFHAQVSTLQPGVVQLFNTIGTTATFADYRLFVDFIDGAQPAVVAPTSPLAQAAFDRETVRRAKGDAVRARAAQARAQR